MPFSNFMLVWKEQIKCGRKRRIFQLWLTVSTDISAFVLYLFSVVAWIVQDSYGTLIKLSEKGQMGRDIGSDLH